MRDYQNGELAKEILKGLALGGFIIACLAMPGLTKIVPLFKPKGARDRYRIKRTITNLQKKKTKKNQKKKWKQSCRNQKRRKKKVLEYNLDDMKLKVPTKWD